MAILFRMAEGKNCSKTPIPVVAIASLIGYEKRKDCQIAAQHKKNQTEAEKQLNNPSADSNTADNSSYSSSASMNAIPGVWYYANGERRINESLGNSNDRDIDSTDDYWFGADVDDVEDYLDWEAGYTEDYSHRDDYREPEHHSYESYEETHHYNSYDDDFEREWE